jgi:hypothetical protein
MARIAPHVAAAVLLASLLSACGGGKDTPVEPPPVEIPTAAIALGAATGTVQAGNSTTIAVTVTRGGGFAGDVALAVTGAPAGVTVSAQTVAAGSTAATLNVVTTTAAVAGTSTLTVAGTGTGVTIASQTVALTVTVPAPPIVQIGSDITNGDIQFAGAIALSTDGTRMVVGASQSANGTTRVYQRAGGAWTQLGADIIGEAAGDFAGSSVDINAAGTRIAIGAYRNSGNGTEAGHVRVYDLVGTTWTQVGADMDGNLQSGFGSRFGWRVALSASGDRVIASAQFVNSGFARVYDLVGGTWTQVGATLSVSGINGFGDAVDVSSDGTTIAVSAPIAPSRSAAGSVFVYRLVGGVWTLAGNVLTGSQTTTNTGEEFGDAISLSANGSRIAVAATSNREGPLVNGQAPYGQVRVFDLVGSTWTQVGNSVFATADIGINADFFGETLMMSDDGTRFVANAAGNSVAKVYTLFGGAWTQTGATIVAPAGVSVRSEGLALSRDGKTAAVGYVNGTPRRVRVFSITP